MCSSDLGNPMMDGVSLADPLPLSIDPNSSIFSQSRSINYPLIITLLPGSRPPEAYGNWRQILIAVDSLIPVFEQGEIICLAAITPTLDLGILQGNLDELGWIEVVNAETELTNLIADPKTIYYRRDRENIDELGSMLNGRGSANETPSIIGLPRSKAGI